MVAEAVRSFYLPGRAARPDAFTLSPWHGVITMFEHILIGVDGREGGRDAIALATQLKAVGGELTLAHVYSGDPHVYRAAGAEYAAAERSRSLALLERAREDADLDASLRYIEAPSIGRGLHQLADREAADLIVIGSCRRGLLGRVLVGDDTAGVLHGARCAAAVAPAGHRRKRGSIREVGVGYDGSTESAHALERARELARDLGATLSALQVVEPSPSPFTAGPMSPSEAIDELVTEAHQRLRTLEGVEPHAAYGEAGEELTRYSGTLDLLVVGSRGYGAIGRLIHGSTSARLASTARCPLVVVPGPAAATGEVSDAHPGERAVGATS